MQERSWEPSNGAHTAEQGVSTVQNRRPPPCTLSTWDGGHWAGLGRPSPLAEKICPQVSKDLRAESRKEEQEGLFWPSVLFLSLTLPTLLPEEK